MRICPYLDLIYFTESERSFHRHKFTVRRHMPSCRTDSLVSLSRVSIHYLLIGIEQPCSIGRFIRNTTEILPGPFSRIFCKPTLVPNLDQLIVKICSRRSRWEKVFFVSSWCVWQWSDSWDICTTSLRNCSGITDWSEIDTWHNIIVIISSISTTDRLIKQTSQWIWSCEVISIVPFKWIAKCTRTQRREIITLFKLTRFLLERNVISSNFQECISDKYSLNRIH